MKRFETFDEAKKWANEEYGKKIILTKLEHLKHYEIWRRKDLKPFEFDHVGDVLIDEAMPYKRHGYAYAGCLKTTYENKD